MDWTPGGARTSMATVQSAHEGRVTMSDFEVLLDLQRTDDRVWTAPPPSGSDRQNLYGGLVAAQALRAGHLSVGPTRQPHSMHAYFLRSGRFDEPLGFHVDETRDGGSFSARRIEVVQSGGPILTMIASFQEPEWGDDYQIRGGDTSPPSSTTTTQGTGHETGTGGDGPFEMLEAPQGEREEGSLAWSAARYWCRARASLGDAPILHACALVAMGDLRTGVPVELASTFEGETQMTSLDYAMWFHRDTRADAWLLFDLRAAGNGGARGLGYGLVHDAGGTQSASFAMEMLYRPHRGVSNSAPI